MIHHIAYSIAYRKCIKRNIFIYQCIFTIWIWSISSLTNQFFMNISFFSRLLYILCFLQEMRQMRCFLFGKDRGIRTKRLPKRRGWWEEKRKAKNMEKNNQVLSFTLRFLQCAKIYTTPSRIFQYFCLQSPVFFVSLPFLLVT